MRPSFAIARYDGSRQPRLRESLDRIFFATSATRDFADADERARFCELWLGRYLENWPGCAFLALSADEPIGYLAGADVDPVTTPLFSDIGYFAHFAHLTPRFPAHFHVNVLEGHRAAGAGSALVSTFAAQIRGQGVPGMHVVTRKGARNVRFYERNGFIDLGCATVADRDLVFLGREL